MKLSDKQIADIKEYTMGKLDKITKQATELVSENDKLKWRVFNLYSALKNLIEIDPIKAVHLKDDDFWLECLYCAEEIHASLSFYDDDMHEKNCPYIEARKILGNLDEKD